MPPMRLTSAPKFGPASVVLFFIDRVSFAKLMDVVLPRLRFITSGILGYGVQKQQIHW